MSEGQMILLFCVVYSGALSIAIWANLVARQRMQAHLVADPEQRLPERYKRGA